MEDIKAMPIKHVEQPDAMPVSEAEAGVGRYRVMILGEEPERTSASQN